ncbi:MAG: peptidylprolyl isomerase [Candidatus Cloacimonadaceae bacterium]|nr:peptidylprolyl isomerase [Candidatus Cloacimonadaceae bacterium]
MKIRFFIIVLAITLLASNPLGALHFARWSTSLGTFNVELYDDLVPITANNFISLANSGFYNGLIFHRVINGFVIQDGCPYGTGYGGPGYTIQDEFHPDLNHNQAGILAMARTSAPNSAGSQYYFTLAPQPHLNGSYAVFGKVIQGLDVVLAIGAVPTNASNLPLTPVTIDTLRILDLSIGTITPLPTETILCSTGVPQMFIIEAFAQNSTVHFEWRVDGVAQNNADDFIFETAFNQSGEHQVQCYISSDDWQHTITWNVVVGSSVSDETAPPLMRTLHIYPNPSLGALKASFHSDDAGACEIGVYDLRGRLVYREMAFSALKGVNSWQWNGLNRDGDAVPTGIYRIRVKTQSGSVTGKCLILR